MRNNTRQSGIGFTLVELLVVVAIIALLVAVILPAMNKVMVVGRRAKTQSTISMIDGACRHYFNDFEEYPPSHDDDDYSDWYGGQLLALFLTGYGPDTGGNLPSEDLSTDDGVEGFGFRLAKRGRVYGPYSGCEKLDTKRRIEGDDGLARDTAPFFIDAFKSKRCILYYRFSGSGYESGDNRGVDDKEEADGPEDVNDYAKNDDGEYYKTDFILISRGVNKDWDEPQEGDSDDVTNFFIK